MDITDRIQLAISHSGQTKMAVAKYCQISRSAITQWVTGVTKAPSPDKLLRLARATGVSYTWLLYGKGEMVSRTELRMHDTEIIESLHPLQPDEIDLPYFQEVELAAGGGRTEVIENHGQYMRFSLERLNRAGVKPENAACATVIGRSMEPVLTSGSTIGIDRGAKGIIDGSIYALDHDGMLRVKRLYRAPMDRIRLVSENAAEFPEETLSLKDPDGPKIIGKVFWWEVFA